MWFLPRWSLSSSSASSRSPMCPPPTCLCSLFYFCCMGKAPLDGAYGILCQKEGGGHPTCVFVPHQVVHHTSHVPSLLRVQDPQHSLRGPHQRPWVGKIPGGGHDNPSQYSCLENPMDRGPWQATVHRVTQSQTPMK